MQSSVGVKNQDIDSCLMKQEYLVFRYSLSPQSNLTYCRAKLLRNGHL